MDQRVEDELVDNAEAGVDIDRAVENDEREHGERENGDREVDELEDEFFEEVYSEILEAVNRNAEHLKLLHKSFENIKLELFDSKSIWYQKFFREIETANDAIEHVEEEMYELSD